MLACVEIALLPVQVEHQRLGHVGPLLIGRRGKVYEASNEVLTLGVQRAMRLYKARQLAPDAEVVEADEWLYHQRHEAAVDALAEFADQIESVALGQLLFDIDALAQYPGGPVALARAIRRTVASASHLAVSVGIAANRFTAQQAARQPDRSGVRVIAVGDEAAFLSPLSVDALPLRALEHRRRLHVFGVATVGQFSMLPVNAVTLQFGADAAPVHAMARGRDTKLIRPDAPPLRDRRARRFDEPLVYRRAVLDAGAELAAELGTALTQRGYHAESLCLRVTLDDGQCINGDYALKPPTADPDVLARRVRDALGRLHLTGPVNEIDVVTQPLRPWHMGATQMDLFGSKPLNKAAQLGPVLATLARRFGEQVVRLAAQVMAPAAVPAQVVTATTGEPKAILEGHQRYAVAAVLEHWIVEGDWWDVPTRRDYYKVDLGDGLMRVVYQESGDGGPWFADRSLSLL